MPDEVWVRYKKTVYVDVKTPLVEGEPDILAIRKELGNAVWRDCRTIHDIPRLEVDELTASPTLVLATASCISKSTYSMITRP